MVMKNNDLYSIHIFISILLILNSNFINSQIPVYIDLSDFNFSNDCRDGAIINNSPGFRLLCRD